MDYPTFADLERVADPATTDHSRMLKEGWTMVLVVHPVLAKLAEELVVKPYRRPGDEGRENPYHGTQVFVDRYLDPLTPHVRWMRDDNAPSKAFMRSWEV